MEKLYDLSLTIEDLRQKKEGFLLVRVLRKKLKIQKKENSQLSILIFHAVDRAGETIKCEMMGIEALRHEKKIHPKRLYELNGAELAFNSYVNTHILHFKKDNFEVNEVDSPLLEKLFLQDKYNFVNSEVLFSKDNTSFDILGHVMEVCKEQEKRNKNG